MYWLTCASETLLVVSWTKGGKMTIETAVADKRQEVFAEQITLAGRGSKDFY